MRKLFLFLCVFLLFIVIVQVQQVHAKIVYAEAFEGIGPFPLCWPGDEGILLDTELDKKGNKVEIWCDGGQYLMKFIYADGSFGYVGKCPFPDGQNYPEKKVIIAINTTDNSTWVEEIRKTIWKTYDAPFRELGGTGINKPDRIWVHDSRIKKYFRRNTLHNGTWVIINGNLTYNITIEVPDGNLTEPATPPENPDDLYVIGDPPPEEMVLCEVSTPEYELYTPIPVTFINEYGNIETNVYKIPYGKELVIEKIEAVANQPFIFDIEVPGEKAEVVTYSLINNPSGMYINPVNGVIQWIPNSSQLGYNNVAVMIEYYGLSPDIDQFILQVLSDYDNDGDGIVDSDDNCPGTTDEQPNQPVVYGCSCLQILELKPGMDLGELRNGCSNGTLNVFRKQIGWARIR